MERKRLQRLQRILKVQAQQERSLRYNIEVHERDLQVLEERSEELIAQWNGQDGALRELLNTTIDRRLKQVEREQTRICDQKQVLQDQLLEQRRQSNMAEKQHKKVLLISENKAERSALQDLAELQVTAARSGPDKSQ